MNLTRILLVIALSCPPTVSFAQDAPSADEQTKLDIRCLVSALPLAQSSDPKVQMAGLLGSMYWFGRVGAQVPDQNLEDRIMAEVEQMKTGEVFQAEAKRCGLEMAARGQKLQAIGEDMQKKGKVLQQMENSR